VRVGIVGVGVMGADHARILASQVPGAKVQAVYDADLRAPVHTETNADLTNGIAYPADWRPRFADAYRLQAQAWIRAIQSGTPVGASTWDGYAAAAAAEAGLQSLAEGRLTAIRLVEPPAIFR
jgi:myo-inositol 2-dehydrogenase / D-chiro-inositol 1-dehydrogenase